MPGKASEDTIEAPMADGKAPAAARRRFGVPESRPIRFLLMVIALGLAGCRSGGAVREGGAANPPAPAEIPAPRPAPASPAEPVWPPIAGRTVILDAGHGGKDAGASHHGVREKDICLDLARRTAGFLQARGVIVRLTRDGDVFLPLPARSDFVNRHPGAVFVSIHANAAAGNPAAAGVETYILGPEADEAERERQAGRKYRIPGSDPVRGRAALAGLTLENRNRGALLAECVQKRLAGRLGVPDRGIRKKNLAVLRETYFSPAILVEVGFLTHPPTAAAMGTEEWRRRASEALGEGIVDFLRRPAGDGPPQSPRA
ncbi:MAG: N-acetylmuramoyl-L-alanine amidase [Planctomycetota bacterium]|jgi:N-acetylmuramoyl-L-alanine amidase|nr:N-acetylmuramoyl-L-alanine amidase [Planctomycetota bacterium]